MKTRVPIIETKAAIKCGRLRIIGADKAMKQMRFIVDACCTFQ